MGRSLEVVLDESLRSWRGGETVRGEVVVEVHERAQLFEGTWNRGTHRHAFAFGLPHGPYSYEGHDLNVGWRIEARGRAMERRSEG